MRKRIYIQLAVGIGLLILVSQVPAQQEQWLQYHSSREASQILGEVGLQAIKLSTEQPAGVKLPQFKGKSQLFAKWPTPMVKSGWLWMALDRTHEQGPYDLLYIDSNGNGGLDDETASAAYRTDQRSSYFGPAKVIFEVEDGPVTYHLNFRSYQYGTSDNRLYASSGGWYEGDIQMGLLMTNLQMPASATGSGLASRAVKTRFLQATISKLRKRYTNLKLPGMGLVSSSQRPKT